MNILKEPSYTIKIKMAGDYDDAVRTCREYCNNVGLCVTVERADYVYTGGMEQGVIVGLVNYPRFPTQPDEILKKAEGLVVLLMERLCQTSSMIDTPEQTYWYTNRDI